MDFIRFYFFRILAPIYIILVGYRIYGGVNIVDILIILFSILSFYLPIQIITEQKKLPINISIFEDEDIKKIAIPFMYISLIGLLIFTIFWLTGKYKYSLRSFLDRDDFSLFIILSYYFWYQISKELLQLVKTTTIINKIKFSFILLALVTIFFMEVFSSKTSSLTETWQYILIIPYVIFFVFLCFILLFPQIGLPIVMHLFNYFTKEKIVKQSRTSQENFIGSDREAFMFYGILFLYLGIFLPTLAWLTNTINSLNPSSIAFLITFGTILSSAFAVYFQLQIFLQVIVKNIINVKKVAIISMIAFYGLSILGYNFSSNFEKNVKDIELTQKAFNKANNLLNHNNQ